MVLQSQLAKKKRNVESMKTKKTNTGCVIKYTLTTAHLRANQVYSCATKLSPRNKSAVLRCANIENITVQMRMNKSSLRKRE